MFSKQNLLATVVATIAMFVLGFLIWGVATVEFFEGHTLTKAMKDPPDFPILVLSNLIAAFALSTIYGKWANGNNSLGGGFQFGVWIGIFMGLGMGLLWYATSEFMDLTGHLVEAVLDIVYYGIIGAVIGLMYKATEPKGGGA